MRGFDICLLALQLHAANIDFAFKLCIGQGAGGSFFKFTNLSFCNPFGNKVLSFLSA